MSTEQLPPDLRRVHMVGIGGAGMSGIARILLDRGGLVSGSDAKESRGVHALRARGALIRIGHDASSLDLLPGGATAVRHLPMHPTHPQNQPRARRSERRGIPVVLRPAVLAKLMAGRTTLMVTGTHGKTTTTSMLIVALQHCGLDPSFAVGGELGEAGTNAHHGSGDCFVAEADESDGSLLQYTPHVAVITNIESDHLDFYGSVEAYVAVFDSFVERIVPGGALVVCTDDPGGAALAQRATELGIRVLRYGSVPGETMAATLVSWQQQGVGAVAHIRLASELATAQGPRVMRLSVPGRHMALNALGALLAAVQIGAPADEVLDGLAGFEGVRRRFELVGTCGVGKASVRVFDDYAHHPTEISATLAAARMVLEQGDGGRCMVVFQPHLYSRTKAFAAEFGRALNAADEVFVLDVYGAREQPLAGVSGASVAEHVTVPMRYVPDFSAVAQQVAAAASPGDVIVTMGAGDVTLLGPEILTALRVRANRSAPGRPGCWDDGTQRGPTDRARGRRRRRRGAVTEPLATESKDEPAEHPEFEGPRRRARRERAERRAAQARATAIEQARRAAKRRARGQIVSEQNPAKPAARGVVRGLKALLATVVLAVVGIGLGLALYFTPAMSAREIVIIGIGAVSREEVLDAARVRPATPLLQIDTQQVADRVATIRRVASARVQRQYPSALRITIVERVPVVVKDFSDGPHLFDRDGVDFATDPPPPALPYFDVDNPGPSDPTTKAALQVLTALHPEVASQVGRIAAPSVASITLTLADGRVVIWGTTDRCEEKAEKLAALLTQPGRTYDVSSPDLPTVK